MSRCRGLFGRKRAHYIVEPREEVPRTENEEARRAARDWLRDRDEDDVPDWGDETELSV